MPVCVGVSAYRPLMDLGMQTENFGGFESPHPWGDRPDGLPLSAAVWDAAKTYDRTSQAVVDALYKAVKQLEANQAGNQS